MYKHDARTQSPRLTAAKLQLAVGRRGLGPREQGKQRTRLWWLRIMREYTQSGSSHTGLGCFVEKKYHVKRPGTCLRGQNTRVLSVGLDARVQGRAKCARHGAGRSSSRWWLEFSEPKNLTTESHEQKKIMTRASSPHKKPVSILHE